MTEFNISAHFAFECAWQNFDDDTRFIARRLANPDLNITYDDHMALRMLAVNGLNRSLKLMLDDPRSDPGAADNDAIIVAALAGRTETVRMLILHPLVDVRARRNLVIHRAAYRGYHDMVEMLLNTKIIKNSNEYRTLLVIAFDGFINWKPNPNTTYRQTDISNGKAVDLILDFGYRLRITLIHPLQKCIRINGEPECIDKATPELNQIYLEALHRDIKQMIINIAFGFKSLNLPVLVQHTIAYARYQPLPPKYKLNSVVAWNISKLVHLEN